MKIKTVWDLNPAEFDKRVNEALAEGYILGRRDIVPDARNLDNTALYAELVLLDPAPEPEPVAADPWELVRQLREFCDSVPKIDCVNHECPLQPLCGKMTTGKRIAIDEWEV